MEQNTETNKDKPRTGFGSMQPMAVRTLDYAIVRIALYKCCFLNEWFVFHIVFFSRVSQVFFFLISPSFWFHLILVPPFAIGLQDHVRSSVPVPYKYLIMFCRAAFTFVLNVMLFQNSYLRLHRTTFPNIVFFIHRHDNSNRAVNSVFI
jgi:hypothetical protein